MTVGQPQRFYPEEDVYFPALISINQEISILALKIGRLGQALRAEATERRFEILPHMIPENAYYMGRQTRVQNVLQLIHNFRARWRLQFPSSWGWLEGPESLPPRVFEWVQHV